MDNELSIYHWEGVNRDWSGGAVWVVAHSVEEARVLIIQAAEEQRAARHTDYDKIYLYRDEDIPLINNTMPLVIPIVAGSGRAYSGGS